MVCCACSMCRYAQLDYFNAVCRIFFSSNSDRQLGMEHNADLKVGYLAGTAPLNLRARNYNRKPNRKHFISVSSQTDCRTDEYTALYQLIGGILMKHRKFFVEISPTRHSCSKHIS